MRQRAIGLVCLTVLFLVATSYGKSKTSSKQNQYVYLKDVTVLTFRDQARTKSTQKGGERPALVGKGGSAASVRKLRPGAVQCTNRGSDGQSIQWSCEGDLAEEVEFGAMQVICEPHPKNKGKILVGSCHLEYELNYRPGQDGSNYYQHSAASRTTRPKQDRRKDKDTSWFDWRLPGRDHREQPGRRPQFSGRGLKMGSAARKAFSWLPILMRVGPNLVRRMSPKLGRRMGLLRGVFRSVARGVSRTFHQRHPMSMIMDFVSRSSSVGDIGNVGGVSSVGNVGGVSSVGNVGGVGSDAGSGAGSTTGTWSKSGHKGAGSGLWGLLGEFPWLSALLGYLGYAYVRGHVQHSGEASSPSQSSAGSRLQSAEESVAGPTMEGGDDLVGKGMSSGDDARRTETSAETSSRELPEAQDDEHDDPDQSSDASRDQVDRPDFLVNLAPWIELVRTWWESGTLFRVAVCLFAWRIVASLRHSGYTFDLAMALVVVYGTAKFVQSEWSADVWSVCQAHLTATGFHGIEQWQNAKEEISCRALQLQASTALASERAKALAAFASERAQDLAAIASERVQALAAVASAKAQALATLIFERAHEAAAASERAREVASFASERVREVAASTYERGRMYLDDGVQHVRSSTRGVHMDASLVAASTLVAYAGYKVYTTLAAHRELLNMFALACLGYLALKQVTGVGAYDARATGPAAGFGRDPSQVGRGAASFMETNLLRTLMRAALGRPGPRYGRFGSTRHGGVYGSNVRSAYGHSSRTGSSSFGASSSGSMHASGGGAGTCHRGTGGGPPSGGPTRRAKGFASTRIS